MQLEEQQTQSTRKRKSYELLCLYEDEDVFSEVSTSSADSDDIAPLDSESKRKRLSALKKVHFQADFGIPDVQILQ